MRGGAYLLISKAYENNPRRMRLGLLRCATRLKKLSQDSFGSSGRRGSLSGVGYAGTLDSPPPFLHAREDFSTASAVWAIFKITFAPVCFFLLREVTIHLSLHVMSLDRAYKTRSASQGHIDEV